jgi:hypothetical protein
VPTAATSALPPRRRGSRQRRWPADERRAPEYARLAPGQTRGSSRTEQQKHPNGRLLGVGRVSRGCPIRRGWLVRQRASRRRPTARPNLIAWPHRREYLTVTSGIRPLEPPGV